MILLCLLMVVQILALPITDVPQQSGVKISFKKSYPLSNKRDFSASISKPRLQYITTDLQLGTQQQLLALSLDTGSSDLWVIGADAKCGGLSAGEPSNFCLHSPSYSPSQSNASVDLELPFKITYWGFRVASGDFYQDDVAISGITVHSTTFAVVNYTEVNELTSGMLGIGLVKGEANGYEYTNFPAQLVKQGLISRNYYSLYLDAGASTGTILFGGIDSTQYDGELVTIPFISDSRFTVTLSSVSGPGLDEIVNGPVGIDSGAVYSVLPNSTVLEIANLYLNPEYTTGFYEIDCTPPPGNLNLNLGDAVIEVPLSSLIVNEGPRCVLYILTDTYKGLGLLGDNILSWAYLVYDLDNLLLLIAKPKFEVNAVGLL